MLQIMTVLSFVSRVLKNDIEMVLLLGCIQVLLGRLYLYDLLRRRVHSSHFGRKKMAIELFYIKFNDFFNSTSIK